MPQTRSCLQHHLLAGLTQTLAKTDSSPLWKRLNLSTDSTHSEHSCFTQMCTSVDPQSTDMAPSVLPSPYQITAYTSGLTPATDPTSIHTGPGSSWCLQHSLTHIHTKREHRGLHRGSQEEILHEDRRASGEELQGSLRQAPLFYKWLTSFTPVCLFQLSSSLLPFQCTFHHQFA